MLGLKCEIRPSLRLHQRGMSRQALDGFKHALEALADDPGAVILRSLAYEGVRPPQIWSQLPLVAVMKRLLAGLVGLGPDGQTLAYRCGEELIIAHIVDKPGIGKAPAKSIVILDPMAQVSMYLQLLQGRSGVPTNRMS